MSTVNFRTCRIVWQRFAKIGSGALKNLWPEKKEKGIIEAKYNCFLLDAGDCNKHSIYSAR